MNRVRIVALSAVVLGAAVVVGTRFQQSGQPVEIAETSVPAPPAVVAPSEPAPSLTALAAAEPPAAPPAAQVAQVSLLASAPAANAPVAHPSIAAPLSALTPPDPAQPPAPPPGLARASVIPGAAAPGAGPGPAGPAPDTSALRALAAADGTAATAPAEPVAPLDPELQAELAACAVWLVVTPAPGAMLETSVYAPCDGGAPVTLTHAGLSVDLRLAADGQLLAQIPALTDQATVTLRFADGREQSDQTQVPDLGAIERVVLQWQAPAQLQLNAYEFGAHYGDAGHVYAGRPRAAGVDDQGFLTVLGDPTIERAHLAQIYSYPRGESPRTGSVALEIEVPVTDATCGHPLVADTIELHGTASAQVRQIRLDMPDCDGNGGYLVLPGVLPELQIALNN